MFGIHHFGGPRRDTEIHGSSLNPRPGTFQTELEWRARPYLKGAQDQNPRPETLGKADKTASLGSKSSSSVRFRHHY